MGWGIGGEGGGIKGYDKNKNKMIRKKNNYNMNSFNVLKQQKTLSIH